MVHPGALVLAVESGNINRVKEVGNAMQREGWTVNWARHAQTAKNKGFTNISAYLASKGGRRTKRVKRRPSRR
jgi:hypothetical protein